MPVGRNISSRVPELFGIYRKTIEDGAPINVSDGAKRLSRSESMNMLQQEFHVTSDQADLMFQHFDVDCNSYLSQWECQHLLDVFTDGTVKLYNSLLNSKGVCSLQSCESWSRDMLPSDTPKKQFEFQINVLKDQSATDGNNNGVDLIKFAEFKLRMDIFAKQMKNKK